MSDFAIGNDKRDSIYNVGGMTIIFQRMMINSKKIL